MSLELLGLGMDFIGGLMGQSSRKKELQFQQRMAQQAQRQFDAQMDQSVQRRVADARKAGVHPLFALGASVGSSPTIAATQTSRANPMQNALTSMARQLGVIEQNRASARKDEAEAMLMDSERKRIEQELNARGQDTESLQEVKVVPKQRGTVLGQAEYVRPQVAQSQRTGVEAGTHPERVEYVDKYGHKWTLPSQNLGLDEVNQVVYALQWIERQGRLTRRKIEQVIQDAAQKRRKARRNQNLQDWISP